MSGGGGNGGWQRSGAAQPASAVPRGELRDLFRVTQQNAVAIAGLQEIAHAHHDRLVRLESTGTRVQPWLALAVALAALCLSALCGVAAIVVEIALPHLH